MKSFAILVGAAVSLLGAAAFAEDPNYWENRTDPDAVAPAAPAPAKTADSAPAPTNKNSGKLLRADPNEKKLGIALEAGGGFGGFIDKRATAVTTTQGQWTARMVFGTRSHLGGEAAYVGSAQTVNTLGLSPNATLTGNGAEGAFRLNVLTGMFQPYATAGIGWMHYSMGYANITTSDIQSNGDVATFPVGVGMAVRLGALVLDSRFSFHPATSSAILRDNNMSTWDLNARAGFEF